MTMLKPETDAERTKMMVQWAKDVGERCDIESNFGVEPELYPQIEVNGVRYRLKGIENISLTGMTTRLIQEIHLLDYINDTPNGDQQDMFGEQWEELKRIKFSNILSEGLLRQVIRWPNAVEE